MLTLADYFKAALGWKPSQRPFHTSANRECGNVTPSSPVANSTYPSHRAGRTSTCAGSAARSPPTR